jgi:predicted amidohydrolase YtcJ
MSLRKLAVWCLACVFVTGLLAGCAPETAGPQAADTVFRNGKVYTVDANRSIAAAVAVRDGRIVFVGADDEATSYIGAATTVVDLRGRMMLPGMQDIHVHPIEAGVEKMNLYLGDLKSIDAYKAAIVDYAQSNKDLPWIIGSGWEFHVFGPGVTPDRKILDALAPDRPVYLASYDDHAGWANSAALRIAGISKDTPDPPGGRIVRDPVSGEPTGTLEEEARQLVFKVMPTVTTQQKITGLRDSVRTLNAWGITSMQDAGVDGEEELQVYKALEDAGELTMRVVAAMRWYPERGMEQVGELVKLRDRFASELMDAGTAKLWQDGVMENYTAVMLEPYLIPSGSRGEPLIDPEVLKSVVTQLDAAGLQVHVHAIGDGAVRQSLDAIEASIAVNGRLGHRHHIAHLELIDPDDIPRFGELDVVANFQPLWAYDDVYITDLTIPFIGPERARWLYPIKSVMNAGGLIAFGSDWSVTTANPFPQIETAITRQDAESDANPPFIPEECIDLETAIAAFTVNAAFVNRREKETGSIEVGKYADLIVVDQDLFAIDAKNLSSTTVLLTIFAGRIVYGDLAAL